MLNLRRSSQPELEVADLEPIRDPEVILDRRKLAELLAAAADQHAMDDLALRSAVLRVLRTALDNGREVVRHRFLEELGSGDDCVREQAWLLDQLIRTLADFAAGRVYPAPSPPAAADALAIGGTGGYGRGELAPQSDVDLLFLLPPKNAPRPRVQQVVEFMLYVLWDLGLKVGHAVRTVDDCIHTAKQDSTIRTNLLEHRPIWGDRRLHEEFRRRYVREVIAGTGPAFVEAKLAERDERHRKMGDSRYVLEPNIKEGKGGLRDLQTLFWIGKYLYQTDVAGLVARKVLTEAEAARFAKAQTFLNTLRCHLHYLTGRPEDRLTFDVQREIGRRMGYTDRAASSGVERFMKHYFLIAKDIGDLTRIFCAALEAESQRRPRRSLLFFPFGPKSVEGFVIDGERLNVADEKQFRDRPVDMIRLFYVAQRHDLDIHPNALRLITRSLRLIGPELRNNREANRLFLEILTSPKKDPEVTLRRMNEAGVMARFIPDFGRVVAQMQYDMYHIYTVDEHTLFAIGTLHKLETGALADRLPLATEVVQKIVSRRALYVAMLLHDIAKGRGGDHSVKGARIARQLGPRFGLTEEETETAEWLVRWHLIMSHTALRRDLEDGKTVEDFVAAVESPERLRLLLVLTTADISAVGPGCWTAWKGTLLSQLYHRAMDQMSGSFEVEARDKRVQAAQAALRAVLADWPEEDLEAFFAKGYPPYWLSFDPRTHAHHARLVRQAEREGRPLTVETRIDRGSAVTEVTVYTADHPGLFSRLAGALAVCGADIVEAKIFTLTNGMALDVFNVQDAATGAAFDAPDKLARLSVMIGRSLSGKLRPMHELAKRRPAYPSRTRVFRVQPRVLIDNHASRTYTVIEVNGRDRPGLLYDVTRAITSLSLQIFSAKISTFGERAIDVFYVKDVFGLKVTHESKLQQVRERLLSALVDPDCLPGPPAPIIPLRRRNKLPPAVRRTMPPKVPKPSARGQ